MSFSVQRLVIFDLGKTNAKMILREPFNDLTVNTRSRPNTVLTNGPYPHYDITGLMDFIIGALVEFSESGPIDAIMVSTHGAGIACMSDGNLAMPIMDYDFSGLDQSAAAYDAIRSDVTITGSHRMPRGLHLGAQLHWLMNTHRSKMRDVDQLLFLPQYWTYWLSGVATSEIAYASCHTDLWNFQTGDYLDLPTLDLNLPKLMPPFSQSGTNIGPLRDELCQYLRQSNPPMILGGGHDSTLALVPSILDHVEPVTVLSTGTWICVFALNVDQLPLDLAFGQMISLDPFGNFVPNIRFMGGEILARFSGLSEKSGLEPNPQKIEDIFDAQNAWLSDENGAAVDPSLIPKHRRMDLLSGFLAQATSEAMDAIGASGPIYIDGPFAKNSVYLAKIAHRQVHDANGSGVISGIERLLRS